MIRTLVLAACAMLALAGTPRAETDVARWNRLMLDAAMATRSNDLVIARMLAVVHRATYDAWAAYDAQAAGIHLDGNMRRPAAERTEANKREAIAHAAFHTLVDLMPTERPRFMAASRGQRRLAGRRRAGWQPCCNRSPRGCARTCGCASGRIKPAG